MISQGDALCGTGWQDEGADSRMVVRPTKKSCKLLPVWRLQQTRRMCRKAEYLQHARPRFGDILGRLTYGLCTIACPDPHVSC